MTADQKKQMPDDEEARAKPPAGKAPAKDEQNQATTKEFDEEGMGVAPKE